jgi:predicted transcriptional regulator
MTNTEHITLQLDQPKREQFDQIATALACEHSDVLNHAIDLYLDIHRLQIQEIQAGIAEAEARDFASQAEVDAVFVVFGVNRSGPNLTMPEIGADGLGQASALSLGRSPQPLNLGVED